MKSRMWGKFYENRRSIIGGSDARIIMGNDEAALIQLWREKRGEADPEDLSSNLVVQLGAAAEELNRFWYERNTGHAIYCTSWVSCNLALVFRFLDANSRTAAGSKPCSWSASRPKRDTRP